MIYHLINQRVEFYARMCVFVHHRWSTYKILAYSFKKGFLSEFRNCSFITLILQGPQLRATVLVLHLYYRARNCARVKSTWVGKLVIEKWECFANNGSAWGTQTSYTQSAHKLPLQIGQAARPIVVPARHATFPREIFDCHLTSPCCI